MEKNGNWWKGSFPTWIVALLIAIIGFFLKHEMEVNYQTRQQNQQLITQLTVKVEALQVRITLLEKSVNENHLLLNDVAKRIRSTKGP
jgi:hypothetical protein